MAALWRAIAVSRSSSFPVLWCIRQIHHLTEPSNLTLWTPHLQSCGRWMNVDRTMIILNTQSLGRWALLLTVLYTLTFDESGLSRWSREHSPVSESGQYLFTSFDSLDESGNVLRSGNKQWLRMNNVDFSQMTTVTHLPMEINIRMTASLAPPIK